jgi:hypothetical protein
MGFQSPISYNVVILFTFKNGKLIETKDLSNIAASVRNGNIKLTKDNIKEMNLIQWIDDCFDISFFKKAKGLT